MPESSRQNSEYYKNTKRFQFLNDYLTANLESNKYYPQKGINEEVKPYHRKTSRYDNFNSDVEPNQIMKSKIDQYFKYNRPEERLNFEEESKGRIDYNVVIDHIYEYNGEN